MLLYLPEAFCSMSKLHMHSQHYLYHTYNSYNIHMQSRHCFLIEITTPRSLVLIISYILWKLPEFPCYETNTNLMPFMMFLIISILKLQNALHPFEKKIFFLSYETVIQSKIHCKL